VARAVRWSGRARSDLRAAVEYIRRDSPASAARFLDKGLGAARSLENFPDRGSVVEDLDDPDVRQLWIGRYRLLYEARDEAVWVLRVVHGSRDLLLALGKKSREDATGEEE